MIHFTFIEQIHGLRQQRYQGLVMRITTEAYSPQSSTTTQPESQSAGDVAGSLVTCLGDLFILVKGMHYTSLMENPWKSTYPTVNEVVGYKKEHRVQTTVDLCNSKHYLGSSTNGVSPLYADKSANYSITGLGNA